jgi:hypothetical protein
MARTPWQFAGYDFPVNPEEDSDWIYEHLESENIPINATSSNIQFGGRKSARRRISGYIWGPSSATQHAKMQSGRKNKTQGTLVDHLGNSQSAILIKFEPKFVRDAQAWAQGRSTWRYDAEFIAIG